jgi:hypothetical protein
MFSELTIDLQRSPENRWHLTPGLCDQAKELLTFYRSDLGIPAAATEPLMLAGKEFIQAPYWKEMEAVSSALGVSVSDVALSNLYYDALKAVLGNVFGCTAFAVDLPEGVLHARNLDWWSQNGALARNTLVCHFKNAPAGDFTTIGWPGFIGAYSGIAPGRFAVTLNAVLSLEPAKLATPITFLLRQALEEAKSFKEALSLLSETPIPCDCLLLLTGIRPGELVVVERTPTRHAIRQSSDSICVTNGYQLLEVGLGSAPSELAATCCQRLERVQALLKQTTPKSSDDCFRYLSDGEVRMQMTVQQMVFRAATGEHWLKIPEQVGIS